MSLPLATSLVSLLRERQRNGLPDAIIAKARLHIADAIGIARAAAGSGALAGQVFAALAAGGGGGACGVLGSMQRHAAPLAAFANSALIHDRVDLETLNDAALGDQRVSEAAQRIEIVLRLPDKPGHPPVEIKLETKDGRSFMIDRAPEFDDMAAEAVRRKFDACLRHAGAPVGEADALWSSLMALEGEKAVAFLFAG